MPTKPAHTRRLFYAPSWDAEFYKRRPRKDGCQGCAWLGRGVPGPHQQTLGTHWWSHVLQDPNMGVGLGHRELWALETATLRAHWQSWRKASATSGSRHRVDVGGAGGCRPTSVLGGCDRMSTHIIRVQTEGRPEEWYVAEALSAATPPEISALCLHFLEDWSSHHDIGCNPPPHLLIEPDSPCPIVQWRTDRNDTRSNYRITLQKRQTVKESNLSWHHCYDGDGCGGPGSVVVLSVGWGWGRE